MKKVLFSIVAVLALAVSLVSCNNNSPKASAEKFLNGLNHMDYESAKTVSTEETKKMLDMMSQLTAMLPDSSKETAKKVKVKVGEEKIDGDKATVSYTTSEDTTAKQLSLVKEKGKWLVQWTKNDNPAGAGAGTGSDANAPQTTQPAPGNDTAATQPVEGPGPGNDTAATK